MSDRRTVVFSRPLLLAALLVSAWPALADPTAGAVEIWLRAFIPNSENSGKATGYIVPRPNFPGQSQVRLLPTDKLPNGLTPSCFVTDNRSFSSAGDSTARVDTKFTIIPIANGGKISPVMGRTTAGVTIEVTCNDGAQIASAPGKIERDNIGTPAFADGMIQVIGQVQGKNELAAHGLAPSIDYSFDFRWSPWTGKLKAVVNYGSFPAFEVYGRVKGGNWKPLHQHLPTGNPWDLAGDAFGIHTEKDDQTVVLPATEGTWQTTDVDQRFRLEISGGKYKLVERSSSGQTLSLEVTTSERPDGALRLSRPNDNQVLTFLGIQPSLRAEILAKSPQASYIDLRFDGDGMRADWYGLLVTKDANAHLKELVQPGTRPPKNYSFIR